VRLVRYQLFLIADITKAKHGSDPKEQTTLLLIPGPPGTQLSQRGDQRPATGQEDTNRLTETTKKDQPHIQLELLQHPKEGAGGKEREA